MKTKTNYWMLSSFFMMGWLIGFAAGRFIAPKQIIQQQSTTTSQNNGNIQANNNNNNQTGVNTTPIIPTVKADYASVKIGQTTDKHWTLGDPKAKVKIEEYSDFQCPFCDQYFNETFGQIFENYIKTGKVYYVFYNYPLPFHPDAPASAKAAACAGDQNKFWEMHDELFETQNIWSGSSNASTNFKASAAKLGLNTVQFNTCLDSTKYNALLTNDTKKGNQNGVKGTPTFLINGKIVVGAVPYTSIQSTIDAALIQ